MMDAARLNRSAHAHPVRRRGSLQRLDLRNRVIVRLALSISEPCEKAHGNENNPDANPEFVLFLHGEYLLHRFRNLITSPEAPNANVPRSQCHSSRMASRR